MKTQKHAWALAALLAASGAAWAQSSVTLYGVVDVGFGKMHGRKVGMMTSEAVNHTTSHIGFKGVEDLGGGLKTGFRQEQAINLKNGERPFCVRKPLVNVLPICGWKAVLANSGWDAPKHPATTPCSHEAP